jgi:hypothetical protein
MSNSQAAQTASRYLKEQAEIMKKYGPAPKLSGPQYQAAKTAVTKTFKTISSSK